VIYFPDYQQSFEIHKIIQFHYENKKKIICILNQINTEHCSVCPATIMFIEWLSDNKTGQIQKKYQTIIDSSGSFGDINGNFNYLQIDTNTSVILYHDIIHHKSWTTQDTYIIQDGIVQYFIPETAQSDKMHRTKWKKNIVEYNTVFTIDNKTKTINTNKTGILYEELINEKQIYKLK